MKNSTIRAGINMTKDTKWTIGFSIVLFLIMMIVAYDKTVAYSYLKDFQEHNLITSENQLNQNSKTIDTNYIDTTENIPQKLKQMQTQQLMNAYPKMRSRYDKLCTAILLIERDKTNDIQDLISDVNMYLNDKTPASEQILINQLKSKEKHKSWFNNESDVAKEELEKRQSLRKGSSDFDDLCD